MQVCSLLEAAQRLWSTSITSTACGLPMQEHVSGMIEDLGKEAEHRPKKGSLRVTCGVEMKEIHDSEKSHERKALECNMPHCESIDRSSTSQLC